MWPFWWWMLKRAFWRAEPEDRASSRAEELVTRVVIAVMLFSGVSAWAYVVRLAWGMLGVAITGHN